MTWSYVDYVHLKVPPQNQVEAIFYLTLTDIVNLSWMLAEEVSGIRMTSKFEFNSLRSRKSTISCIRSSELLKAVSGNTGVFVTYVSHFSYFNMMMTDYLHARRQQHEAQTAAEE